MDVSSQKTSGNVKGWDSEDVRLVDCSPNALTDVRIQMQMQNRLKDRSHRLEVKKWEIYGPDAINDNSKFKDKTMKISSKRRADDRNCVKVEELETWNMEFITYVNS